MSAHATAAPPVANEGQGINLRTALLAISIPVAMTGIDATILNVALPTIAKALDTTSAQLVWINSAYILIFGSTILLSGNLGDKYGRKRMLTLGMVIFILGSIAAGLSKSPNELIIARMIQGLGGGMIAPSTLSLITNIWTDPAARAKAIGTWAGMSAIGIAVGPILGGLLLTFLYWGSVFFINVPVVIIGLYMVIRNVPESKNPEATPIDYPGAVLAILGLLGFFFYLIEAPERGWTDPAALTGLILGLLLLIAFGVRELRTRYPELDLRLFKQPAFSSGVIAIAIAFFALMGTMYVLTLYLQSVRLMTPLQAGFALVPLALMIMVGSPAAPRVVERRGVRTTVVLGLLLLAAGMLGFFFVQVESLFLLILAAMVLAGLGVALTATPASTAIMGAVPKEQAGMGSATNATMRQIAASLGIAVIGGITQTVYAAQLAASGALNGLPADAAQTAQSSITGAEEVAAQMGAAGAALASAANAAFVQGLHTAMIVTLAAALIGALIAARAIPNSKPKAADHTPDAAM
jgi:EmrB/QacA subfamily drug resistance transporter